MGDEKKYSEEEAMHLVAREVAKQRMADLERNMKDGEGRLQSALAELKIQIANQTILIEKQSTAFNKSITDFREEIDSEFIRQAAAFQQAIASIKEEIRKDFASKTDLHDLKAETEAKATAIDTKVEKQWLTITATSGTIVAVALVVQYVITALNSAKNLVK